MRHTAITAFLGFFMLTAGGCNGKSSTNDKHEEQELISSFDIPSKQIIEYDEEESAPFNGLSIASDTNVIITSKNEKVRLCDIAPAGTIVARYSNFACKSCIEFMAKGLVSYIDSIGENKVIMIAANVPYRDLHVIRNTFNNRFEFYAADSILTDFDSTTPYLFMVDDSMRVSKHFIPRQEIPERYRKYLGLAQE